MKKSKLITECTLDELVEAVIKRMKKEIAAGTMTPPKEPVVIFRKSLEIQPLRPLLEKLNF